MPEIYQSVCDYVILMEYFPDKFKFLSLVDLNKNWTLLFQNLHLQEHLLFKFDSSNDFCFIEATHKSTMNLYNQTNFSLLITFLLGFTKIYLRRYRKHWEGVFFLFGHISISPDYCGFLGVFWSLNKNRKNTFAQAIWISIRRIFKSTKSYTANQTYSWRSQNSKLLFLEIGPYSNLIWVDKAIGVGLFLHRLGGRN